MLQKRVFYGWWVLLGIFISYTALVGIQVYTFPLFYPALIEEFGWSTKAVTLGATLFFLTGACITPFVSSLFDRFSARAFMIAGGVATVCALFGYSSLQTLGHLTIVYVVLALSQVCAGQVPTMMIVARWFNRYRGIAFGITLIGPDLGGAIFPLIVRPYLVSGEWRRALVVLMIISGIMMLLPMIFLIRNRPEERGLRPDGDPVKEKAPDTLVTNRQQEGPTLREALRTPAFYILAFTTGSLWFCMNGIVQHQTIFMNGELGISMETIPLIVSSLFWFAIAGKLLIGYLSDHFNKVLMMLIVVVLLIAGLSILRLASADKLWILYCFAAVFGIGYSGTFTMIQLVIAEFYFGKSYGKILGILTMVDVGAGGLAITIVARMQESFNSYLPVFDVLIALTCTVAVLVLWLYRMRRNVLLKVQPA